MAPKAFTVAVLIASCILLAACLAEADETLTLTVSYCPTLFTSKGALVTVDTTTGHFKVLHTFDWPSSVAFGCAIEEDPIVTSYGNDLFLSFPSTDGVTVKLDLTTASLKTVKPSDPFFTGFINMGYDPNSDTLLGISGTVTENGFCDDGCFQWGSMSASSGHIDKGDLLPYKAVLDDSHGISASGSSVFVQASYPLTPTAHCSSIASDQCLLTLDMASGNLESHYYANWTVYKWGQDKQSGSSEPHDFLTWMVGFDELCQHPYNDFLFADVQISSKGMPTVKPRACIPKDVTVQMDEWISNFNAAETLMATGSGDAYAGVPQLLVFDTSSAKAVLKTNLTGLAHELGASQGLFDIWSVDFV